MEFVVAHPPKLQEDLAFIVLQLKIFHARHSDSSTKIEPVLADVKEWFFCLELHHRLLIGFGPIIGDDGGISTIGLARRQNRAQFSWWLSFSPLRYKSWSVINVDSQLVLVFVGV